MNGYAFCQNRLGKFRIDYEDGSLTGLQLVSSEPDGPGNPTELTERASSELAEYLDGTRKSFDLPILLKGTPFQKKVWMALCSIPYGETRSYKDIAVQIGIKNAFRAVGMANNRNPLMIIVPCHRVIGSDGSLTGYACGLEIKRELLSLEKSNL